MKNIIVLVPLMLLALFVSCDSDSDAESRAGGGDAAVDENIAPIFLSTAPALKGELKTSTGTEGCS